MDSSDRLESVNLDYTYHLLRTHFNNRFSDDVMLSVNKILSENRSAWPGIQTVIGFHKLQESTEGQNIELFSMHQNQSRFNGWMLSLIIISTESLSIKG